MIPVAPAAVLSTALLAIAAGVLSEWQSIADQEIHDEPPAHYGRSVHRTVQSRGRRGRRPEAPFTGQPGGRYSPSRRSIRCANRCAILNGQG